MTTDHDNDKDSAVKPHVIDLEAEDVTPGAPHSVDELAGDRPEPEAAEPVRPAPPPPPPPAPRRKSHTTLYLLALAIVVGLVAGAWIYRAFLASYFPTDQMAALQVRVDGLEANSRSLADQVAAAAGAADQAGQSTTALASEVKAGTAATTGLKSEIAALDSRIAAAEKAMALAKEEMAKLRAAISSGGTGGGGTPADAAALAAIGQRLDALEKDVASLKAGSGAGGDAALVSALRQSLSDLQAKIAAGLPYKDVLDRILRAVPSVGGNDALVAYADQGLPNAKGLAAELRAAIPTLPRPDTTQPADQGYLGSIWEALTSIVTIRDVGAEDWPALAETAAASADDGDLAAAIAAIDKAQGAVPATLSQWRERASGRLRLEAALAETVKAVSLVVTARGGGQ